MKIVFSGDTNSSGNVKAKILLITHVINTLLEGFAMVIRQEKQVRKLVEKDCHYLLKS